ncbi:MAG: non-canonical purine NTP pyrophosphatase [Chlamydiota bacterium]
MKTSKKVYVVLILCLLAVFLMVTDVVFKDEQPVYKLNTSNPGKLQEFRELFKTYGYKLEESNIDLDEVDADPLTVVVHKASQLHENIIVEDTSLDVEGADIGVNIRWLLDDLDKYLGKKAVWTVFLAYRSGDQVEVFRGEVIGKIVKPHGNGGFGFDPYFLPDGADKTLAYDKLVKFNARAKAVEALVKKEIYTIRPAIYTWEGEWQQHD